MNEHRLYTPDEMAESVDSSSIGGNQPARIEAILTDPATYFELARVRSDRAAKAHVRDRMFEITAEKTEAARQRWRQNAEHALGLFGFQAASS